MNIAQNIARGRRLFPNREALVFEGKTFTYRDLDELSNRFGNSLSGLGVVRGDRVALFLPNIPEFVIAYLGVHKIGGIVVSLNAMLKKDEVKFILQDCGAKLVITTAEMRQELVGSGLPCLEHVVITEGEAGNDIAFESVLERASAKLALADMGRDDPAVIVYTSGTTGFPKGATLSHGNVISNVYSKNHYLNMCPTDRLLLYVPLFHCFGQNAILNSGLNACSTIVLQRRFDPERTLEIVGKERVTLFCGVPTAYIRLLNMDLSRYDLSSIRYYFTAAAPMPVEIAQRWYERLGIVINEGYGLTETSPFASYNHELRYKFGSIGTPIENVEMRIVDADGQEVAPGEWGEIVIRGPNVMLGYWNRPAETAQVIKNSWFHSGDIGVMDDEDYFYIVDRLKDMINVSGFKVYPAEVENVIYQHPAVAEVAVYGMPDPVKGEIVQASVVLKDAYSATEQEIVTLCREQVAKFKCPQSVKFVNLIPKNATGKVLKRVLREDSQNLSAPEINWQLSQTESSLEKTDD